ncbi:hypothetical protein [Abyssisolibacter fermentans]|uniref:hypothetical protein n=1 Tax=Abyssisolibacter fermentans TaxID=1766203 RepID=UPI000829582C|nr:hypothetical protein [Abyssisolibacter fermentans]
MKDVKWIFIVSLILLLTCSCSSQNAQIEKLNYESIKSLNPANKLFCLLNDSEGWEGDFADLPLDNEDNYELEFKHSLVPVREDSANGLMLKGYNRKDSLFMYITKKLTKNDDLKANTKYKARLSFQVATNQPTEGLLGENTYVKAGIVNIKPEKIVQEGFYRINIDKGSKVVSGTDMRTLGNIAKVDSRDKAYQFKSFESIYEVETNDGGEAFIIIGVDSNYKGLTNIYITNIRVIFTYK